MFNLATFFVFVFTVMSSTSAQAQKQYPTEYCSNRAVDLALGRQDVSVKWFTGNLCVKVYPNLKDIKVVLNPSGRITYTGDFSGSERAALQTPLTIEPLKAEQYGANRKYHLMKIKGVEADLYLTIFTTLDGAAQDAVAILSYHTGQVFNASNGKYTKTEAPVSEGFPEETISLMRSILE